MASTGQTSGLQLIGGNNYTTLEGDVLDFVSSSNGWLEVARVSTKAIKLYLSMDATGFDVPTGTGYFNWSTVIDPSNSYDESTKTFTVPKTGLYSLIGGSYISVQMGSDTVLKSNLQPSSL